MNRYWLLVVILLAAVVFSPDPGTSRAISAAHDFAHAPVFGCVAVLLLVALRRIAFVRHWSVAAQYATAIAGSAVLGLATEIAQALAGRDSSWIDVRSDVLGAIAFAAMFAAVDRRVNRTAIRVGVCTLGVVLMLIHSLPFAQTALAYARRNQQFPVLFDARDSAPDDFAGRMFAQFAYQSLPPGFAAYPNEQALRIRFKEGPWLGMYIEETYPDWSSYSALALDMTNPSAEPLSMSIRIHDRAHNKLFEDRFNRPFVLAPRARATLVIPLAEIERGPVARKLDLTRVAQLVLFTTEKNASREVYVSKVWLQ